MTFAGRRTRGNSTALATAPQHEEVVGWIPAVRGAMPDPPQPEKEEEATQPMPIVGEVVVVMKTRWRCVSVSYADESETKGQPELRVRFKVVGP